MSIYFDNAATTKISSKALEALCDTSNNYYANPSANYSLGIKAKKKLENCRNTIASLLKVSPSTIYFTSGGTESNSIILSSLLWSKSPGDIIISRTEHASVINFKRILKEKGYNVIEINAPNGFVSPETLEKKITDKTRMVVIQTVNNVIGSINDIESLVKVVRRKEKEIGRKIYFHSDAVQAIGKIDFDINKLDVDSASFSAHKFHGPKGIGFLYCKNDQVQPLSKGGGQENGLRGGTENLASIASMTVALEETLSTKCDNVIEINKYVRKNLKPEILSPKKNCSPFIINFSLKSFPSEVFTRMLDDEGFLVSAGSACSNNAKNKGEGVLIAMNFKPQIAKSSIRISFNKLSNLDEVKLLVKKINSLYDTLVR
ncbi:MAG: cysteine desulfurase family protein [Pleomorphochaeta sp.]